MMAKIVLVALIAFVAVQLSHAAPKPDEAAAKSEAPAATKAADTTPPPASQATQKTEVVAREAEVKVGVDAVPAVEKSTAAAPAGKD